MLHLYCQGLSVDPLHWAVGGLELTRALQGSEASLAHSVLECSMCVCTCNHTVCVHMRAIVIKLLLLSIHQHFSVSTCMNHMADRTDSHTCLTIPHSLVCAPSCPDSHSLQHLCCSLKQSSLTRSFSLLATAVLTSAPGRGHFGGQASRGSVCFSCICCGLSVPPQMGRHRKVGRKPQSTKRRYVRDLPIVSVLLCGLALSMWRQVSLTGVSFAGYEVSFMDGGSTFSLITRAAAMGNSSCTC